MLVPSMKFVGSIEIETWTIVWGKNDVTINDETNGQFLHESEDKTE